jgi:hypothetical protein
MTMKLAAFEETIARDETHQKERLAKWAAKLAQTEDPAYEMAWSTPAFEAAAELAVIGRIRLTIRNVRANAKTPGDVTDEAILAAVATTVRQEAMRGAACPEFSTSVVSNLMTTLTTRAWARMAERFEERS